MTLEKSYRKGFLDGLAAYAVNKDGEQFVGSCGRTLKGAQKDVDKCWNYNPPFAGQSER